MKGKKMLLLAGALMLTTALTGCRVTSDNNNTWDQNARNEAAKNTVIELIDAIEAYNVSAIEDLLSNDKEFTLSIVDKGLFTTPVKSRKVLVEELESDKSYQTLLRASTRYNYDMVIDMDAVGEYGIDKTKGGMDTDVAKQRDMTVTTGAVAVSGSSVVIKCNFEVYENADGITPGYIVTDAGTMEFELIYLGTEYKVKTMKIVFNGAEEAYTPRSMTLSDSVVDAYGFGFGQVRPELR